MEPRTVFFFLSLSSLFYCTAAACVNNSGIKRRMFPSQVTPPSCTIEMSVQAICNRTDNPDLCASSIKPYLPSSGDVFPVDLLRMEIKACASYTNTTIGVATKLANDPKTPKAIVGCLQVCQENYADALYNLQSVDDAIRANDSGMLNSMLSAAMTDYETCEDTFAEEPGRRSPMACYDDTLSKLASNCLAVSELI